MPEGPKGSLSTAESSGSGPVQGVRGLIRFLEDTSEMIEMGL